MSDPLRLLSDALRQAPAGPPQEGLRVGPYVIVNHIKSGGMGAVFRAWQPDLKRWVALKFLHNAADPRACAYFQREAQVAAGLDHPNIAKVYDVGEYDGAPYLAMQFIDGESLSTLSRDIPLERKVEIVREVAEAIRAAHERGIMHRDLKPANVMVDGKGHVYVLDFGLAKHLSVEGDSLTATGAVLGTPLYMAPEQARGTAGQASDLYAVGAIFYELLTGRPPFVGATMTEILSQVLHDEPLRLRRLAPGVPVDLEAIVLKCLEKEPRRRYASMSRLIEDLDAFTRHEPLKHARHPTFVYVLGRRIRRQPVAWGLGMAFVLAVIAGMAIGAWGLVKARRDAEERARIDREARERVEQEKERADRERRGAMDRLAYSYVLRARTADEAGDNRAAALYYAEAYELSPSDLTRPAAAGALARLPRLVGRLSHGRYAGRVTFHPDGHRLLVEGDGVRVWDLSTGEVVWEWKQKGQVWAAGWCQRDCVRVVTDLGIEVQGIRIWTNDEAREFRVSKGRLGQVMLSADAARVAVIQSEDAYRDEGVPAPVLYRRDTVHVVDAETAQEIGEPLSHAGEVKEMVFSPDGMRLLTASHDAVRLWEVGGGLITKMDHAGVVSLIFSQDGSKIVSASYDEGTLRVWDGNTGSPISQPFGPMKHERVHRFAFSPDGERLASADDAGRVSFWEVKSGQLRYGPNVGVRLNELRFSRDGTMLVSAGGRSVRLWDARSGVVVGGALCAEQGCSWVDFSPDGRVLAVSDTPEGKVYLWDVSRGGWRRPLESSQPEAMAFHGQRLAIRALTSGSISIYDTTTGRLERRSEAIGGSVLTTALSAEGASWAEMREGGITSVFDLEGRQIGTAIKHGSAQEIVLCGRRLVTLHSDGTVRLWDVDTGGAVGEGLNHPSPVVRAQFSRDGKRLLTVFDVHNEDGSELIRAWDAKSGKRVGQDVLVKGFWSASPDGMRIIAREGDSETRARFYAFETGDAVGPSLEHGRLITWFAWSEDGARVASVDCRGVRVWDVRTGNPIGRVIPATDVDRFAFTCGGRVLVTAGLTFWDIATGEAIAPALEGGYPWVVDLAGRWLATTGRWNEVWLEDLHWLTEAMDPAVLKREVQSRCGLRLDARGDMEEIPLTEWRK